MQESTMLRIQSKLKAKQAISGKFMPSMLAGLIYGLPECGFAMLTLLLSMSLGDNYPMWLDAVLPIARIILLAPLMYGFYNFCIALHRGEPELSLSRIFEPFGSLGMYLRAVKVDALIFLYVLPVTALQMILLYAVPEASAFYWPAMILCDLLVLLESVLNMALGAAYCFLYDEPELTCREAVKRAFRLYCGRLGTVLIFAVSFVPWMFAAGFTCGILIPFFVIYETTAFVIMTDRLRGVETQAQEPPTGI